MKNALLAVSAIALLGAVVWAFWAKDDVAKSAARPWPAGMGPLDARVTPGQANAASAKLTALAQALPNDAAAEAFVAREVARGELAIGEAPALADVFAIRELLLREPVVWQRREGIGGDTDTQARRAMQMKVARALVASALAKARANDPAAWDDLRAVWNLAQSLDGHPQVLVQTAALAMARTINAVAWKLPLPAPPWLAELQQRDSVPPLLAAFHAQSASYAHDGLRVFPTKMLAASIDKDRGIAEALAAETRCDVSAPANDLGVDLTTVWRRAFRYRAEREATANALRVREGKPIEPASRCSDGTWTFDGRILRFSRPIVTAPPDKPMPLVLRVGARNSPTAEP